MNTNNTVDYDKIKQYLKNLSESYSRIDTFIGFNALELQSSLKMLAKENITALVPFAYEGSLNGNNQRTLSGRNIQFGIVRSISNTNDFNLESQIIADCENIGLGLLSRIHYDSKKPTSQWLYKNFDQNTVEFKEIRLKTAIGLVGTEFTFTLKTPQPLTVDINEWSDLEEL